jgi:hypothetical protein
MYRLCWTQHSSDCVIEASNEVNISKKPPLFKLCFQLTIIVENDLFYYNLFLKTAIYFFQLLTTSVKKYKSKMKL